MSDYVRFRPGSRLLALDDDEAAPHPPEAKVTMSSMSEHQ